jgi:hypothetical protein
VKEISDPMIFGPIRGGRELKLLGSASALSPP